MCEEFQEVQAAAAKLSELKRTMESCCSHLKATDDPHEVQRIAQQLQSLHEQWEVGFDQYASVFNRFLKRPTW